MGLFSRKKNSDQTNVSPLSAPGFHAPEPPSGYKGWTPEPGFFPESTNFEAKPNIPMPPANLMPPPQYNSNPTMEDNMLPPAPLAPKSSFNPTVEEDPFSRPQTLGFADAPPPMPTPPPPVQQSYDQEPALPPLPPMSMQAPKMNNPVPTPSPAQTPAPQKPAAGWDEDPQEHASDFQLPDFDDGELQALLDARQAIEESASAWANSQEEAEPIRAQAPEPAQIPEPTPTPAPAPLEILRPQVPDPRQQDVPIVKTGDKYLSLKNFFIVKESLAKAKITARNTEEEMLTDNSKEKNDAYKNATFAFNSIQDKLMIIDTKLFEQDTGAEPEVDEE